MTLEYVKTEYMNDKPVIVMHQTKFWIFTSTRRFLQERRLAMNVYSWRELPNFNLVPDLLAFRLDSIFNNLSIREVKR